MKPFENLYALIHTINGEQKLMMWAGVPVIFTGNEALTLLQKLMSDTPLTDMNCTLVKYSNPEIIKEWN